MDKHCTTVINVDYWNLTSLATHIVAAYHAERLATLLDTHAAGRDRHLAPATARRPHLRHAAARLDNEHRWIWADITIMDNEGALM